MEVKFENNSILFTRKFHKKKTSIFIQNLPEIQLQQLFLHSADYKNNRPQVNYHHSPSQLSINVQLIVDKKPQKIHNFLPF